MIIPINNGKTNTPIYIPDPVVTTNSSALEQSNTNSQSNEPTLVSWIVFGVFLLFIIGFTIYAIKWLKYYFGGEE